MVIEALITAFIVSIDGFFSGFAVGVKKTKILFNKLVIIGLIPIIMAMVVMFVGGYVRGFINNDIANYIGFFLFIFLAISSLYQIRYGNNDEGGGDDITFFSSVVLGFTIGIDSSISAFSLALSNHSAIITPIYFGLFHGVLIWIGNRLALNKNINNIYLIKYLSPILFTIIAISKLL